MQNHQIRVRPEIELSWKRSEACGIGRSNDLVLRPSRPLVSPGPLKQAAELVLRELAREIQGTGVLALLADRGCRLLASVGGLADIERSPGRNGTLRLGVLLSEDAVGTNAIGTATETRRASQVEGSEHYLNALSQLSCYASPVVRPGHQRVEGTITLTTHLDGSTPMLGVLGQFAANYIERRLMRGAHDAEARLIDAYYATAVRSMQAVCVIGDELVMGNLAAQELLEIVSVAELRRLGESIHSGEPTVRALWTDTERELAITISPVGSFGAVYEFDPRWRRSAPIPRRVPSPDNAREVWGPRLKRVQNSTGSVSLTGEPGTGRSTAARALTGYLSPLPVLDAQDLLQMSPGDWSKRLSDAARGTSPWLVVENAELLPSAQRHLLGRLLSGTTDHPRIVVTSAVGPSAVELEPVVARCAHHAKLAPLRERVADFPALAEALLLAITGGNRLRLSPSALNSLATQPWPGNLAELRTVLTQAANGRSTGHILAADLPEGYRNARGLALPGRERAERQAIIESLRATCGNKSQAAEALGISRATLYRRIRALKVPG